MLALEWHQKLTSLRECCVKCGLLLNLQYRKWSDETIWCDRRHHVVVVGSAVIGNLCPKGNVWCSVPVGFGDGTSGIKRTVCHWGFILSALPFYLNSCFIFPFANWRHAGKFPRWITFPFLQTAIMTTTGVDCSLNTPQGIESLSQMSSCLSSLGPVWYLGLRSSCRLHRQKDKVLALASLPCLAVEQELDWGAFVQLRVDHVISSA